MSDLFERIYNHIKNGGDLKKIVETLSTEGYSDDQIIESIRLVINFIDSVKNDQS